MTESTPERGQDLFTVASVFHFVVGGLQMLLSLVGLIYVGLGYLMATGQLDSAKASPPPEALGWVFGAVGMVITLVLFTMGILVIRAGLNMIRKRKRVFCIVVDAILCLMVPFGTIVGIFGLILLMKPESEELFTG